MPRVNKGDNGGGVRVPGIYDRLLEVENIKCASGQRSHGNGQFSMRPRGLLDALTAGRAVVMNRRSVEARHEHRFRFPWEPGVRSVRVSPDDVVWPTSEEHPWYGRAADDGEGER